MTDNMQYDVFICHASEDKDDFVRPLAELLRHQHVEVWYDEFSLSIGDSLTQKIDEGLQKSKFGIVVLSPNFFKKPWAKRELSGLTFKEMLEKRDVILPIWHRVTVEEVAKYSLPLADKKAASSVDGINSVLRQIIKKVKPDDSPLVIAREELVKYQLDPPPISDEWWLDIVEFKEELRFPDLNVGRRWIFPLPFRVEERGKERGMNIASAALQMDWSFDAEELNIGPTTPPEKVHEFIRTWPGLYECARKNPTILALYAPQLTIPGFDEGFEDVFDALLTSTSEDANRIFSYGGLATLDEKKSLCGNVIALRHPTFGNYRPEELGYRYFYSHDTSYIRSHYDSFEGLVWLLGNDSEWLPIKYRQMFIDGILKDASWSRNGGNRSQDFVVELMTKTRSNFKLTPSLKKALKKNVEETFIELGTVQDANKITERLIEIGIVKHYYDFQDWLKLKRKEHSSA
ncbi:MAG: TIR domain-containing protein [Cyclobacteriaceae bacterium]